MVLNKAISNKSKSFSNIDLKNGVIENDYFLKLINKTT